MADFFESRCVSTNFTGSGNLVRVACIGDSMMYGQGVPQRQTLPAHIGRFLNAALLDDLVWVDNFGQSSGNLWHSWVNLKGLALHNKFDALVFSVCQNDSQIFESNTVRYDNNKLPYWSENSFYFAHVRKLFIDVADVCRASKISPVIVYYSFVPEDLPISESLDRLTQELSLPFINMLKFYQGQTSISAKSYRASEFDGHPSGLAHELAARSVTRELLGIMEGRAPKLFGKNPRQTLADAMTDIVDQRVPVDATLRWARELLSAKYNASRRRSEANRTAFTEICLELGKGVEELENCWLLARRVEAARMAVSPSDYSNYYKDYLPHLFDSIRNLDEATFLTDKAESVENLIQFSGLFAEGGYFDQFDRLSFFRGNVREEIQEARDRFANLKILRPDHVKKARANTLATCAMLRSAVDLSALSDDFAAVFAAVVRFQDHVNTLEAAAEKLGNVVENPAAKRFWAITLLSMRDCLVYFEAIDAMFSGPTFMSGPSDGLWTQVDVRIEGDPNPTMDRTVCCLQVEIDYNVPNHGSIREQLWAGVAKDRAVYHFEFPVMLVGTVRVGVPEFEPTRQRFLDGTTRIKNIEIYNTTASESITNTATDAPKFSWSETDSRLPLVELGRVVLP